MKPSKLSKARFNLVLSCELDPSLFHQPLSTISTDFLHPGDDDAYLFIPSDASSSDSLEDVFANFIQQQLQTLCQLREHMTTRTNNEISVFRLCLAMGSQCMQGLLHRFANHHKQTPKPVFSEHRKPPTKASGASAVRSGCQAGQDGPIHKSGRHRPKGWSRDWNQTSQQHRFSSLCHIPRLNDSNYSPRPNLHVVSGLQPTSPVHGISLVHLRYPGVPLRESGQLKARQSCVPYPVTTSVALPRAFCPDAGRLVTLSNHASMGSDSPGYPNLILWGWYVAKGCSRVRHLCLDCGACWPKLSKLSSTAHRSKSCSKIRRRLG